jgi:hypothetical protein
MTTAEVGVFQNEAATGLVTSLRQAARTAVGDLVSNALRRVAQAEQPVTAEDAQRALAAVALLLSVFDRDILDGAADGDELADWFGELEIELPPRRQVAAAALARILLPDDNGWYTFWTESGRIADATATVHRLRDLLTDSADES